MQMIDGVGSRVIYLVIGILQVAKEKPAFESYVEESRCSICWKCVLRLGLVSPIYWKLQGDEGMSKGKIHMYVMQRYICIRINAQIAPRLSLGSCSKARLLCQCMSKVNAFASAKVHLEIPRNGEVGVHWNSGARVYDF